MSSTLSVFKTRNIVSVGLIILLILPFLLRSDYILHILIMTFFYAYLSQCWNLLGGYTGQLSLGPVAYFGVGAYVSSILIAKMGLNPWLGLGAGMIAAGCLGIFLGYISFRFGLRGPYFALATLAMAEMLRIIVINMDFLGGATGIQIGLKESSLLDFQFVSRRPYYFIILIMLILVNYLTYRIERSRFGYYLIGTRENEEAAQALGIDIVKNKVYATGLSACLTAAGGTFYAQYILFIEPDLAFGFHLTVEIILRAIVGGIGTVFGPTLGSFVLTPLSEVTRALFGQGGMSGLYMVIYGSILVIVVLFLPRGFINWFENVARRLRI